MKTYIYRAVIERGEEQDWVVSFPDVPEAITQAGTIDDARTAAQEALGLALLSYPMRGRTIPHRSFGVGVPQRFDIETVDIDIALTPDVTAKLAVLEAFRASRHSTDELAAMLMVSDREIRDILDPMHATELHSLSRTLEALGQRLVVGVTSIDEAA